MTDHRLNDRRLNGQIAVVAGAGRGIGAAIAETLGRQGAHVVVIDIDADRSKEVSGAIRADGGEATPISADVTSPDDIEAAIGGVTERFGSFDILVNNAGGITAYATWADLHKWSIEDWDIIVGRNLRYVFLTCRAAIPTMIQAGGGAIVNLSSLSGMISAPRHAAYGAAKAGVANLTASLAAEYGSKGVRVNAVAPAAILTEANASILGPDELEGFRTRIPLGRAGTPGDVANVVAFLASSDSAYITGQTILIDGGASIVFPLDLGVTR